MRKILCLCYLLLLSLSASAQIELKINSISTSDSIPTERKFTIKYSFENLTDKAISFFLYPKNLAPFSKESEAKTTIYKIYEEKDLLDFQDIFNTQIKKNFFKNLEEAKTQKEKDSLLTIYLKNEMDVNYQSFLTKDPKELVQLEKKMVLNAIVNMQPKEKIYFSKTLYWDTIRYRKIEDIEYYINEDKPHFIELTINLSKDGINYNLDPEEYKKITSNLNFIEGIFTSNKVEINFK